MDKYNFNGFYGCGGGIGGDILVDKDELEINGRSRISGHILDRLKDIAKIDLEGVVITGYGATQIYMLERGIKEGEPGSIYCVEKRGLYEPDPDLRGNYVGGRVELGIETLDNLNERPTAEELNKVFMELKENSELGYQDVQILFYIQDGEVFRRWVRKVIRNLAPQPILDLGI